MLFKQYVTLICLFTIEFKIIAKTKTKQKQVLQSQKEVSTVSIVITVICFKGAETEVVKLAILQGTLFGVMKAGSQSLSLGFVMLIQIIRISNCGVELNTDTAKTNFSHLICCQFHCHLHGNPLQRTSIGVDIFFSLILSYFCFFVAALRPCQGRLPRLKYMRT